MPWAQQRRAGADRLWPEAGAGPVARGRVERDADDGDVHALRRADVGTPRERADARVARGAGGVRRAVAWRSVRRAVVRRAVVRRAVVRRAVVRRGMRRPGGPRRRHSTTT